MKAKIVKPLMNGKWYDNKEQVSSYSVVGTLAGKPTEIVKVRCWMGRSKNASTVYASLWVLGKNHDTQRTAGHGDAGGWGYHKESAAIDSAIRNAGIELLGSPYGGERDDNKTRCSISGVGDSAIDSALIAIARAAGARGKLLIVKG